MAIKNIVQASNETIYAKIKRLAANTRWFNNPHMRPTATIQPTITATTTRPTGLNTDISYFTGSNKNYFLISGGPEYNWGASGYQRFPVTTMGAVSEAGNITTNLQGTNSRVEFVVNSSNFSVRVLNSSVPHRFIVDGQFLSMTGTTLNTGNGWIQLDYTAAGRATRHVILDMQVGQAFFGISMGASDTLYAPTTDDNIRLGVFGDSYTEGVSGTHRGDGIWRVMGDCLGIRDVWSSGLGGTGYLATNQAGTARYNLVNRLQYDCLPYTFDVIAFGMGINDTSLNQTNVGANVTTCLTTVRNAFPNTPILVFGACGRAGPSAAELTCEGTIHTAVTNFNDPNVIFVPISTATDGGPWLTGAGSVATPSGSGNCDAFLDVNNGHPVTAGHIHLGFRAADAVLKAIANKA